MRTLFNLNPFSLACSYDYLKNKAPKDPSADEKLLGSGLARDIPKAFDISDKANPRYYLINIVRWADVPKGDPPAPPAKPAPQLYKVASDDWYLLNFSNKADAHHDLAKVGHFKPETISAAVQALNMAGDDRLVFLGIHLAPAPAGPVPSLTQQPSIPIALSERAWYDSVKIQYGFHATKVDALNVQDAKTLFSILKTLVPFKLPAALDSAANAQGALAPLNAQVAEAPSPRAAALKAVKVLEKYDLNSLDELLVTTLDCRSNIQSVIASVDPLFAGACNVGGSCSAAHVTPTLQLAITAATSCNVAYTRSFPA